MSASGHGGRSSTAAATSGGDMVVDRALPLQHREETGEEEGGVLLFLSSQASAMTRLAEVAVAVEEWEGAGMPLLY